MKITDIYGKRPPRFDGAWAGTMRAAALEHAQGVLHARGRLNALTKEDGSMDFDPALGALRDSALTYTFSVEFGSEVLTFPENIAGVVPPTKCSLSPSFRKSVEVKGLTPYPGMLPIAGTIGKFNVPAGVALVTGGGGVGKTPMAHIIAHALTEREEAGFGLVRYGEPFTGYLKTEREAAIELGQAMMTHRAVVIDSMKDVLSAMRGGLMESGLSRDSLPMFSRLSMLASELGVLLVCPINPSSGKQSVVELIAEVARSNVAMAVIGDGDRWSVLTRQGEGLQRDQAEAVLSFAGGVPSVEFTHVGTVTEAAIDKALAQVAAAETSTSAGESLGGFALAMRRLNRQS